MNWQELRNKQYELDQHIMVKHNLKNKEVIHDRILALIIELAEVGNQKENFKYWKVNKKDDDALLLEEVTDVLHFILSLENYYKFKYAGVGAIKESTLTSQFNSLFFTVASLANDNQDKHVELVSIRGYYIGLIEMLGFTPSEVLNAYNRKYEINFDRQASNY